jgi:hypothetical protein
VQELLLPLHSVVQELLLPLSSGVTFYSFCPRTPPGHDRGPNVQRYMAYFAVGVRKTVVQQPEKLLFSLPVINS